jgi:hypothetical protein
MATDPTTWVTAIGTAVAAVAAVGASIIAWVQLDKLREQIRQSSEQDRRRNTLEACQRFERDDLLKEAMKNVWEASDGGTDYTKLTAACSFDVLTLLNYFDGIAIGIIERVYIDEMARDYLEDSLNKAVKALILGESGDGWKASKPFFPEKEFASLCKLYHTWNPESQVAYNADNLKKV